MDGERFDDLSRALSSGAARRDLLRGLAAGLISGAAAHLLGQPIPEARAEGPCEFAEIHACIRTADNVIARWTRSCLEKCWRKADEKNLLFPLCGGCHEKAAIRKVEARKSCRACRKGRSLPACGRRTSCPEPPERPTTLGPWCVEDRSVPAGGICCNSPRAFADNGVCKECDVVCDFAKGLVADPDFCQCTCDVSYECPRGTRLDPIACRCVCDSTGQPCGTCIQKDPTRGVAKCKIGQDERTCRCKCESALDCDPCDYCTSYKICELHYTYSGPCGNTHCCRKGHYCCGSGGACAPVGWTCCEPEKRETRICEKGCNPDKTCIQ
jgi:hypothetical protein